MLGLALLVAAAAANPRPAPVRAEATATVRIVRPVLISASTLAKSSTVWRESDVRLPGGTTERVRVVDLP